MNSKASARSASLSTTMMMGPRRSADSYVDDVRGMFDGLENELKIS